LALRSFADGALFGETFGEDAPRVLAMHGWGRRGADFNRCLGGLPALALDLPGFGASPPPSEVLGAQGYADIVADVLDECDGPPVLVGHSFGGRVAVCLAAARPSAVGPLVLTGVPLLRSGGSSRPAVAYRLVRALHKIGVLSADRLEAEKKKRGSADYRAATGVMRDILVKVVNEEYPEQMKTIDSEVRMIWGSEDREVPVETAERALGMFAHGDLEVVEGAGHHLPLQAPDRIRAVVESLLP